MKERIPLWRSDRQREHRADREEGEGDISLVSSRRSTFSSLLLLDIFLRPETSRAHHSVDVSASGTGKTGRRGCRLTNREEDLLRGFSSGFSPESGKGSGVREPDRDAGHLCGGIHSSVTIQSTIVSRCCPNTVTALLSLS